MSLSNDFYSYARQGEQSRQRLGYKGPYAITEQQGQPGDPGYVPADITTGLIPAVVIYPDLGTGLDVPGRTGGPAKDFDNSLSIHGTTFPPGISAPMEADVTAPDHTTSTPVVTTVDFNNLRNDDQGTVGRVEVVLDIPPTNVSLIENLANLQTVDAAFEYWDGSTYVAATATRRWDLASVFDFEITLPSQPSGSLMIRTTFGADAVDGEYRFTFTLFGGIDPNDEDDNGIKRFTSSDTFELNP
jgi:hypothetical protein